jgi:hypothetical protein
MVITLLKYDKFRTSRDEGQLIRTDTSTVIICFKTVFTLKVH